MTTEFKKQTGIDLSEFIRRKKIQEAERLLETDRSLSDIGVLLGFSSQSHFTRVFKEIHGMTPTEFRKRHQK
ncbi:helix-turn-helix domain-containing protein [uncultured Ruminococcus sp.]|uniref:helix-turn-helix domain-containing protein n=1 Tax=uncultured Ruminococcus sp. TaxID=165186 RepID=UPI0034A11E48